MDCVPSQSTYIQLQTFPQYSPDHHNTEPLGVEVILQVDAIQMGRASGRTLARALIALGFNMLGRDMIDFMDAVLAGRKKGATHE